MFSNLNRAALRLFDSEEDALEFLEEYDLDEARIKLLIRMGRILDAAETHAKDGDMLKAVEMLSTSAAHDIGHARQMIKYLLTGLQRGFTFGVLPKSSSAAVKLLVRADRLDKSAMTKQEADEVSPSIRLINRSYVLTPLQFAMFEAIRCEDRASLRPLAKTFIGAGNDPAALLCLDHILSFPPKLQDLPLAVVHALHSMYLEYIRLLNKFWSDESLAEGSSHQRLFGFQVLGDHYLVPSHTVLHEKLTGQSDLGGKSADGYGCGYDELRRGIVQLIRSRINDRTAVQNGACRDLHGFTPCLRLLIQKKCSPPQGKGTCTFQHIQPEQLTVDWYRTRIRLILLQFRILNLACYGDWDGRKYVPVCSARNICGYSLNVKLLAWDLVLRTSSTSSEARIVCKSWHCQHT